ncbi:MAG: flagellar basal body-associated protein FliL [Thiohalomonadaceae bacterium]
MAQSEDLDLDVKPKSGNKKLIIIAVLIGLLVAVASVGTTLILLGGGGEKDEAESSSVVVATPHYLPLENMIVNFAQRGPARFLQVEMQLMAHDPALLKVAEQHMPVIRNDLLVLLGSTSYEAASSREGKEKLNHEILDAINRILREQSGQDGIQAVYFTSFVMQ